MYVVKALTHDTPQVPSNDDPTLADKEAILASLNIKAMTFDDTIGVMNQSEYLNIKVKYKIGGSVIVFLQKIFKLNFSFDFVRNFLFIGGLQYSMEYS